MPILNFDSSPQGGSGLLGAFARLFDPQQQMPQQSSDGPAANNGMPMNIAPQPRAQAHPFYTPPNNPISAMLEGMANPPGSAGWRAIHQQQLQQQMYDALQQAGLPEPLARLGTIHPEALGGLAAGY